MDIIEITKLAQRFRQAIDDGFEWGVFGDEFPFSNFPHECCDDVCDLFGQLLIQNNLAVTKVFGTYRYNNWDKQYSHVWLQLQDGIVIDLTGDQYKNDPIMLNFDNPCYIGKSSELHNMFRVNKTDYRPFCGIDTYNDERTRKRLNRLFRNIMQFMKNE